jgi:hypothetical protein
MRTIISDFIERHTTYTLSTGDMENAPSGGPSLKGVVRLSFGAALDAYFHAGFSYGAL